MLSFSFGDLLAAAGRPETQIAAPNAPELTRKSRRVDFALMRQTYRWQKIDSIPPPSLPV
jgi:hypothetical protein